MKKYTLFVKVLIASSMVKVLPMAIGLAQNIEINTAFEKTFVLIIHGTPEEETRNAVRLAYETFWGLGVPSENIFVAAHRPSFFGKDDFNGDGKNDIQFPLTEESIENAFRMIGSQVSNDGQVIIYITSHGSRNKYDSYVYLFQGITLGAWSIELTGIQINDYLTKYFPRDSQKILIVQACKSGGFLENCQGPNRTIITSSNQHVSYRGPIDGKSWPKFSYYFFKALRSQESDVNKDGVITLQEAFTWACHEDHPTDFLHIFFYNIGLWGDDEPQIYSEQDTAIGEQPSSHEQPHAH